LDKLAVKIFRELVQNRGAVPLVTDLKTSFSRIAEKLGVNEVTVRKRIEKLHETGFLRGWSLLVHPHLLGLRAAQLWVDTLPHVSKDDLIRKLRLIQGVFVIVNHLGNSLYLVLFYEDEESLKKQIELISRISNSENIARVDIRFPETKAMLSETDWKIVRSIRKEPQRPYILISKELGLSSKTVKRRIERLTGEGVLFMVPRMNPKALEGVIIADLLVSYAHPGSKEECERKIISHLDEQLVRAEVSNPEYGFFNVFLSNISKVDETLNWTREQSGVTGARLDLVQDRVELYEMFYGKLDNQGLEEGASRITRAPEIT
jgi:DNA-binding Lrp family transcriptional regulator